jgi:hypothetical protein
MLRRIIILFVLLSFGLPVLAQDDIASCDPPLALRPGIRINTRPGINIRNLPSLSGGVVNYLETSITFRVEGGPVCADGVNWWQVRGPINFNPGWVAEKESPVGRYLIFPLAEDLDPTILCEEPLNLVPGSRVPLLNDVKIRQAPNLAGLVLTVAPAGQTVTVMDGPQCADTLNWWLVQMPFAGIILQGWMAEGRADRSFVPDPDQPPPDQICGPALPRLHPGDRASINTSDLVPKNLRVGPGLDEPVLATLIEGIAFDILEGPVCRDNLNWWHIQIVARPEVTGWLSEGGPGNWAITRFTQDRIPGQ